MGVESLRHGVAALLMLPFCALAGDEAAPASAAAPEPEPLPAAAEAGKSAADDFQAEIERLQSQFGPYDPQLGEQLLSLGLVYQRLEKYPDSVQALNQSLHIKRVNEGLQSLNQLPILERLIETNIASENWNELDRNYDLLLWIHRRNFGNGDPRLLPIIDKVGRWKLNAYAGQLLEKNPQVTIKDAEELYSGTVRILEKEYGEKDPRLVDALYGKTLTNYRLAALMSSQPLSHFGTRGAIPRTMVRYVQQCSVTRGRTVCYLVPITSYETFESTMDQQQAKDLAIRRSLVQAGESLKRIVEIHASHPELGADSQAKALIHQGDWEMRYGSGSDAIENYRQAWRLLVSSGAKQEDIDSYFGTPKQVPTLRLPLPAVEKQQKESVKPDYVVASMDVSSKGRSRNVEIVEESNPENKFIRRKAREQLKDGRYRPRFADGEPVDTSGYKMTITE